MAEVQKTVRQFAYDAGEFDLREPVLSRNELERAQNN